MTEKRQTSQGYIIRILQHFATKLWNISNFVMPVLSSCDEIFV
jgi:valyl-tRNA synthetase